MYIYIYIYFYVHIFLRPKYILCGYEGLISGSEELVALFSGLSNNIVVQSRDVRNPTGSGIF